MKISALFGTLALAVIVSGCASNQHVYSSDGKCLTCWNNPITGEPINHDGKANQEQTAQQEDSETENVPKKKAKFIEHKIKFVVPVNVDIAFLKIKKEFNYQTEQEIRQEWGEMATVKMETFSYAYDATPSVYYHMRGFREHNGVKATIDTRIEKQANNQCEITITYWLRNTSKKGAKYYGESLKNRIQKVLGI